MVVMSAVETGMSAKKNVYVLMLYLFYTALLSGVFVSCYICRNKLMML